MTHFNDNLGYPRSLKAAKTITMPFGGPDSEHLHSIEIRDLTVKKSADALRRNT